MDIKKTTLCYIEKDGKYLMIFRNKKNADPCEGKWVGVGGKFEKGETPDQCLLREVFEETGLKLTEYEMRGIVHFKSNVLEDEDMYLYTATSWTGEIIECNEGELHWIDKDKVTSLNLWAGDKYFLEKIAGNEKNIEMTCVYNGDELADVF